ncbi:TPA: ATP-binding protein, partial [Pseudomonas aeruginosa]
SFSSVALTSQMPHTQSEMNERFDTEVIAPYPDRQEIVDAISALQFNPFRFLLRPVEVLEKLEELEEPEEPEEPEALEDFEALEALEAHDHSEELQQLEKKLVDLLNVDEKRRFTDEFRWCIARSEKYPRTLEGVDMAAAKRWVAKRAYDFGWTDELFPSDSSHRHSYSRERPLFERIGAKYEWLALNELLCRLADSNWLSEARVDGTRDYRSSIDLGFHRDIDPTVLQGLSDASADFVDISPIVLEEVSEDCLQEWPFKLDPSLGMPSLVGRTDEAGEKWLVLYEHRSVANRYDDGESREHGLRLQEWRFLMPVVVRKKDHKQLIRFLSTQRSLDVSRWSGRSCTDDGYLLEAPWRFTWDQLMWTPAYFHNQGELEVAFPCLKYHWESHLDASLPGGASAHLPAPWLANKLSITPMLLDPRVYVNALGKPQFVSSMGPDDGSHAYIRQDIFERLLKDKDLACVWTFVAERGVWPGGGNSHAAWRRSEGVVWFERGKPKMESWKEDNCNGAEDG